MCCMDKGFIAGKKKTFCIFRNFRRFAGPARDPAASTAYCRVQEKEYTRYIKKIYRDRSAEGQRIGSSFVFLGGFQTVPVYITRSEFVSGCWRDIARL